VTSGQWPMSPRTLAAYEHVLFVRDWTMQTLEEALGGGEPGTALDDLVARGLLRPSQEDSSRFVPVAPGVGLRRILQAADEELLRRTQDVNRFRALTDSVVERFEDNRAGQLRQTFEVLSGRDITVSRINELLRATHQEVGTVVTTEPSPEALAAARSTDRELLDRGVNVRALYLEGHRRRSAELRDYLAWMLDQGGEVRIAYELPTRLMYFDRHTVLVALDPHSVSAGAVVVHNPGLVSTVIAFFDLVWAGGSSLAAAGARRDGSEPLDFTDLERHVIRLLAEGHKDESISRRTGMSLRSVRRVVAAVADRLGAQSRFELGVRCTKLGLV
jgi:DNA-binding CsgD family transcriptional regulator/sugar-specific transcriptional regulator TrmB